MKPFKPLSVFLLVCLCSSQPDAEMPTAVEVWLNSPSTGNTSRQSRAENPSSGPTAEHGTSALNGVPANRSAPGPSNRQPSSDAISVWESFTTTQRATARHTVANAVPSSLARSIWQTSIQSQADVFKPHAQAWDGTLLTRLIHWTITCSNYFRNPRVCAFCGIFKLGTDSRCSKFIKVPPIGNTPPYAFANAFLARFTVSPDGQWMCCDSCQSSNKPNTAYAVFMSPSYQRSLLNCSPFQQQFLSVLDCRVEVSRRYHGFAHGQYVSQSLLEHPLIRWNDVTDCVDNRNLVTSALQPVLQVLMQNNSTVKRYLTVLEVPSMKHGFPMLPSSSIATIISRPLARSPIQSMYTEPMKSLMSTVTAINVVPSTSRRATTTCGTLRPRDQPTLERPLVLAADGSAIPFDEECSLEQGLFPYLFPFNKGAWDGVMSICTYLHFRCNQLFSCFTLCKNYLLLMFHVRQAHMVTANCSSTMLQSDIDRYTSEHPHATQQQIMQHVLKHSVPAVVPSSPAWFRRELQNLLAMVDAWGLPSFFLTLTADEHSPLKWTEINDMEQLLKSFCSSYSFEDAPVECSAHFLKRINDFLREHIFHENGLLGNCKHYVVRYEVQHRGSLHAHIVIWIEAVDVPRVAAEIAACVPAVFDEASQEFIVPTDPQRLALFNLVTKKQMHTCIENMCLGDNHRCKYGFPHAVQPSHTPVYQSTSNRYLYYRPRYGDRNVVPYHPVILLLWGAHMNLQRITQTAWSFYVLKYAMKSEPVGRLVIDKDAMSQLGLRRMDVVQLETASALILSKPVSPAEAAMICLEEPAVQASSPVAYVASAPPQLRKTRVLPGTQVLAAPVDMYAGRPPGVGHLTFMQYFKTHKVNRQHRMAGAVHVGVDLFDNHVWATAVPFLVRFTDYHPVYQTEAFFYNLLLLHTVFRSEASLITSSNNSRTYFEQCHLNGHVTTMDDVDALLQDYAKRHLQDSEQRERLKQLLLEKNGSMEDILGSPNSVAGPSAPQFPPLLTSPVQFPFIDLSATVLNVDQRRFVDHMLAGAHGLHFLTGGPGSGKTFTVKFLLQTLANDNVAFLACATTGSAATRIEFAATTMHDCFGIPPKSAYLRPLPLESPVYQDLRRAKVIVLDEVSMLSPKAWDFVMYRLLEAYGFLTDIEALLEKILFILVGDHAQLPAICYHKMPKDQVCTACQMYSSFWWDYVNVHELDIPMRHTDPEFAKLIRVMRKQQPTQEHLDRVLNECIISPEEIPKLMLNNDLTVLCAYKKEVAQYNETALLAKFNMPLIHTVHPSGSAASCPQLSDWFNEPHANMLPLVAVGAKVLVLANIKVSDSVANGSPATVHSILYNAAGDVQFITVEITANKRLQKVGRSHSSSHSYEGKTYYRKTFPLMLAYAMTVHKSQGATMDFVLVDIAEAFCPGQLYVALSRVRTRDSLSILHRPLSSNCVPVPFPRLPDPSRQRQPLPPPPQSTATCPLQSDLMPDAGSSD